MDCHDNQSNGHLQLVLGVEALTSYMVGEINLTYSFKVANIVNTDNIKTDDYVNYSGCYIRISWQKDFIFIKITFIILTSLEYQKLKTKINKLF